MIVRTIGVGDGGRGHVPPPPPPSKIRELIFSGNFYVKFGHFSGKNHVKLQGILLIFQARIM